MLELLSRYKYSITYLLSIVAVTGLFLQVPLIFDLGHGVSFSPWAILVGCWFVLRDFSQRELGHYVFIPMTLGIIVAGIMSPAYGVAAVTAAIVSELTDWAIYTFTRKPFHQRVLISSLISGPLDAIVFFWAFDYFQVIPGVQIFNVGTVILGSISKLMAGLVVYYYYHIQNSKLKTVAY